MNIYPRELLSEQDVQSRKKFLNWLFFSNSVGVILVGLIIIWGSTLHYGGISLASASGVVGVHSSLMIIFVIYFNGISLLVYRIIPRTQKFSLKLIHAGLHFLICIGSAAGLAAAIDIHNSSDPPNHFYSLHSWLGIAALSIYYLQFLGGLAVYLLQITPKNFRTWALPIHKTIGQVVLYVGTGAVLTALYGESSFSSSSKSSAISLSAIVVNICGFLTLCYTFVVAYLLNVPAFERFKNGNPEGQHLFVSRRDRVRIYSGPSSNKM